MLRVLTWVLVLAAATATVGSIPALAQQNNFVGVYTDEQMTANTTTVTAGDLLTVYVILSNPRNPHIGDQSNALVETIGCYSFALDMSTNLELLDKAAKPVVPGCLGECTEYRTCYGVLIPVGSDRHITLRSFDLRYLGAGPAEIRLRPHTVNVIEGEMDYWYRDAQLTGWVLPMYPASGSFELPVFVVDEGQVPVQAATWGSLKTIYR